MNVSRLPSNYKMKAITSQSPFCSPFQIQVFNRGYAGLPILAETGRTREREHTQWTCPSPGKLLSSLTSKSPQKTKSFLVPVSQTTHLRFPSIFWVLYETHVTRQSLNRSGGTVEIGVGGRCIPQLILALKWLEHKSALLGRTSGSDSITAMQISLTSSLGVSSTVLGFSTWGCVIPPLGIPGEAPLQPWDSGAGSPACVKLAVSGRRG